MISSRRPLTLSDHHLILLLILAVGAALRFYRLGLVEHAYDNSYPVYDAVRMLDGHIPLLIGQPSSVFIDNPPLMSYFQALFLLVWRSLWAVYIPIVALNTLAIVFIYLAARPLLGNAAALVAAALFAVSPWVIHFSRMTWPPALIPFFTAVIAWGLWPMLAASDWPAFFTMVGSLAAIAMMQASMPAWGVLAQLVALAPLAWRRIPRRVLAISGLVFLAGLALYAIGFTARLSENTQRAANFLSIGFEFHLTREGLDHAVRLVTGRDYDWVWARTETDEFTVRRRLSLAADAGLRLALLAGGLFATRALWQDKGKRRLAIVLLTWWGVPILLVTVVASTSSFSAHIHYLLLSLPAGHMLAAWGLTPLTRPKARWLLVLLLIAITLIFSLNILRAEEIVAARPVKPELDVWSLEAATEVGKTIRDLLPRNSAYPQRIVIPGGNQVVISSLSATYLDPIDDLAYPDFILLPGQDPLLYVLTNPTVSPETLGPQVELFSERNRQYPNGIQVVFARVLPISREDALALPDVLINWPTDAGLTLLGYSMPPAIQPGQPLRLTAYWRVDALLPERRTWQPELSYRLEDLSGNNVMRVRRHRVSPQDWQPGDVYIEHIEEMLPEGILPGDYRVRIRVLESSAPERFLFHTPTGLVDQLLIPITVLR